MLLAQDSGNREKMFHNNVSWMAQAVVTFGQKVGQRDTEVRDTPFMTDGRDGLNVLLLSTHWSCYASMTLHGQLFWDFYMVGTFSG